VMTKASQKYFRKRAQCGKKKQHEFFESAKKHALKLSDEGEQWYNVYRCTYCVYWHVGKIGRPRK